MDVRTRKTPGPDPDEEIEALKLVLAEQGEQVNSLHALVDELAKRHVEVRAQLLDAHATLVVRDEEIERLQNQMIHEIHWREKEIENKNGELEHRGAVIDDLQRALEESHQEIIAMRETRIWRTGERLWRAKARMKRTRG